MLRKNPSGHYPTVSGSAYIDTTAIICGHVIIEDNVFVGPYAVIRADETDENGNMEPITIAAGSNIQDGVVIHSKAGARVCIGKRTSIAHRSIIHGPCSVGNNVFIGFNSVVFRSNIADGCVLRHNCVVEGTDIPEGSVIPPVHHIGPDFDLSKLPKTDKSSDDFSESIISANHDLVRGYKRLANEF